MHTSISTSLIALTLLPGIVSGAGLKFTKKLLAIDPIWDVESGECIGKVPSWEEV